jgi:hypothetical protein
MMMMMVMMMMMMMIIIIIIMTIIRAVIAPPYYRVDCPGVSGPDGQACGALAVPQPHRAVVRTRQHPATVTTHAHLIS